MSERYLFVLFSNSVRLSVGPSVRPTNAGIVPKLLNVSSEFFYRLIG